MALSTVVKVSSINNLSDARFCAGMGVDLMGFCLDKSHSEYITPQKFYEITGWLSGVKTVGEFENSSADEIIRTLDEYKLHYIQVSDFQLIDKLIDTGKKIIFKTTFDHIQTLPVHENIHYYLLKGGEDIIDTKDVKVLKEFSKQHSLLLGYGFTKKNLQELLVNTKIQGIELRGGNEISPGLKDFDGLAEILELLEIDND